MKTSLLPSRLSVCVVLFLAGCVAALPVLAATRTAPPDITANFKFRNIGPAVAGGRVSVVVGIPGNSNVIYAGATSRRAARPSGRASIRSACRRSTPAPPM